jgi:polysaccharide biosynthesis protein PslJ
VTNTEIAGGSNRPSRPSDTGVLLIALCSLLLATTVVVGRGVQPVAAVLILFSAFVAWHRWMLTWYALLGFVLAVVLFVDASRYSLAVDLPLGLELYRVAVALVLLLWASALLVDPNVYIRRTPLDGPVALIVGASLASIIVNLGRVAPLAGAVLKSLTLFLSFVILFYFVSSVVTTYAGVTALTKFIVSGVGVIAVFAILEQRTGFNVFDHLRSVFPFLQFEGSETSVRFGLIRAKASADHPIALGVLFAMILPLGVALARSRSPLWWAPTLLSLIGVMATASRTPILALVVGGVALLWLRPREIVPLLPMMIPVLIVIKIAAPGSIATVKSLFFPDSGPGLIASERTLAGDPTLISGRANLVPKIKDGMHRPLLGQGLGTRQTGDKNPLRNSPILDNQWLGIFLDVGLLGLLGWVWLSVRAVRRLGHVARTRGSPEGVLAAGFAASILGFVIAMLTYDSLAFVQETVVFWVLLALCGSLIAATPDPEPLDAESAF